MNGATSSHLRAPTSSFEISPGVAVGPPVTIVNNDRFLRALADGCEAGTRIDAVPVLTLVAKPWEPLKPENWVTQLYGFDLQIDRVLGNGLTDAALVLARPVEFAAFVCGRSVFEAFVFGQVVEHAQTGRWCIRGVAMRASHYTRIQRAVYVRVDFDSGEVNWQDPQPPRAIRPINVPALLSA